MYDSETALDNKEAFLRNMRRCAKEQNMTAEDIARKAGLKVEKMETLLTSKGPVLIPTIYMKSIADALEVSIDALMNASEAVPCAVKTIEVRPLHNE